MRKSVEYNAHKITVKAKENIHDAKGNVQYKEIVQWRKKEHSDNKKNASITLTIEARKVTSKTIMLFL